VCVCVQLRCRATCRERVRQQCILVDYFNKIPYCELQWARKKFELPRFRDSTVLHNIQYYLITMGWGETRECFLSIFSSVLFRNRLFISHTPSWRLCFFVCCLQYYIFCVCAIIVSCHAQRTGATTV